MVSIDDNGPLLREVVIVDDFDFPEEQGGGIDAIGLDCKVCGHAYLPQFNLI